MSIIYIHTSVTYASWSLIVHIYNNKVKQNIITTIDTLTRLFLFTVNNISPTAKTKFLKYFLFFYIK